MEPIVDSINTLLNEVQDSADFACHRVFEARIGPGLNVQDLGSIDMPVSEQDVQRLISKSKQSAFGFKSDTRIDLNVRKTWELCPDQVQFDNPAWSPQLQLIVREVATSLGVPDGVEAKLNKVLIYEKGGKFDKHKDSEKADGMFGTLVIVLPSEHSGGDIVLEHAGAKKVFNSATISTNFMSYMAWYADVSHGVLPVTSGHRVVLTYNLVHARDAALLSAELRFGDLRIESELSQLMNEWKSVPESTACLVYQLDHKYTEANMRLDHLKGVDKQRGQILYSAAQASGLNFYLASMEKYVYGGCDEEEDWSDPFEERYDTEDSEEDEDGEEEEEEEEEEQRGDIANHGEAEETTGNDEERDGTDDGEFHCIIDICDKEVSLKKVFDPHGQAVATEVSIHEHQVIQGRKAFETIDEEDYSGWTGNEGVSATHYYRSTVVVLARPVLQIGLFGPAWLREGQHTMDKALQRSTERYEAATPSMKSIHGADLVALTLFVLEQYRDGPQCFVHPRFSWSTAPNEVTLEGSTLDLAALAALTMADSELLLTILRACRKPRPVVWHSMGKLLGSKTIPDHPDQNCSTITEMSDISMALTKYDLRGVVDVLAQFNHGLTGRELTNNSIVEQDVTQVVRDCMTGTLAQRHETDYVPTKQDGPGLADLCRWESAKIPARLFEFVDKFAARPAFAIAFLSSMYEKEFCIKDADFGESLASLHHKIIASLKIANAYVLVDKTIRRRTSSSLYAREEIVTESLPSDENISGADLSNVFLRCMENDNGDTTFAMADKLLDAAQTLDTSVFFHLFLPFLHHILPGMESLIRTGQDDKVKSRHAKAAKTLVSSLLELFFQRYIQPQPAKRAPDWRQDPVPCQCNDCQSLNQFLTSSTISVARFPVAQKRRQHLHRQLDTYSRDCTHETERMGRPQPLVVTKTKDAVAKEHEAWFARHREGVKWITKLQGRKLNQVIGKEAVQATLRMEFKESRPLRNIDAHNRGNQGPLGRGAGAKRKWSGGEDTEAAVIDLT